MCPGPCRVGAKGWCAYPLGRGPKGKAAVRVPSCLHWVLQGRGEWGGGIPGAELGGGTVSTTRTRAGLSTLCRAADAPREELPVWPWVRLADDVLREAWAAGTKHRPSGVHTRGRTLGPNSRPLLLPPHSRSILNSRTH